MTREEAINMLHGMRADNLNLDDLYIKDKYEALNMAIKALEQESASTQEYGLTDADTDKYAVQVQNGEGYYNSFGRYVSYDLD